MSFLLRSVAPDLEVLILVPAAPHSQDRLICTKQR